MCKAAQGGEVKFLFSGELLVQEETVFEFQMHVYFGNPRAQTSSPEPVVSSASAVLLLESADDAVPTYPNARIMNQRINTRVDRGDVWPTLGGGWW